MRKRKKLLLILVIIPVLFLFIPIRCTHSTPNEEKEFYIVNCVSEGTTDSGVWIISGSNKDNKKEDWEYGVGINYTQFIMYGKLVKEFDKSLGREVYTLDCTKWQIYSEVKRGNYSFRIPYKHFITIYDLKYFDFLLTD